MHTLTPALSHAFHLLRNDLYVHLEEAESLAFVDDEWTTEVTESARKLILDLVEVIRRIVAQHGGDENGGCRFCGQHRYPCATVQSIHAVLRDPDREFVRLVTDTKEFSKSVTYLSR